MTDSTSYTEQQVQEIVNEALTEALHPEFGFVWEPPRPDGKGEMTKGGEAWQVIQAAKAEAWNEGFHHGRENVTHRDAGTGTYAKDVARCDGRLWYDDDALDDNPYRITQEETK